MRIQIEGREGSNSCCIAVPIGQKIENTNRGKSAIKVAKAKLICFKVLNVKIIPKVSVTKLPFLTKKKEKKLC